jgi:hypothetical protein
MKNVTIRNLSDEVLSCRMRSALVSAELSRFGRGSRAIRSAQVLGLMRTASFGPP